MRIIPVIDLLSGVVVRGVGGLRDKYRPIQSCLVDSAEPLTVARAIRERFGLSYLYVADLDAIRHGTLSEAILKALIEDGFDLLLDPGVVEHRQAELLFHLGVQDVVIGLETLANPELLTTATDMWGDRIVFSLDLKANWPVTAHDSPWAGLPPDLVADEAAARGVTRMIVLDLHRVGRDSGVATLGLCREIMNQHAHIKVITGGGVRHPEDLVPLEEAGIDGVMIASALHDGRFSA